MMKLIFTRNFRIRLIGAIALLVVGIIDVGLAADGNSTEQLVTAAQTFEVPEEVASAYMLFSSSFSVGSLVPATVLRMTTRNTIILVGRYSAASSPKDIMVTGIVIAKTGAAYSHTAPLEESGLEGISVMSLTEVKDRLALAKSSLIKLEKERDAQAQDLERLQQDADVIANVGRIVDAEDELGAVHSDEQRLSASISAAKARLAALRELPSPTNYQKREAELSAFLADFAKASRDTNSEIFKKVTQFEEEGQKNRALIEESKFDHVDVLQKELISLRKEREAVERSRQVVVADRPAVLQRETVVPDEDASEADSVE